MRYVICRGAQVQGSRLVVPASGVDYDPAFDRVVELDEAVPAPQPGQDRYEATLTPPFRPATAEELAAWTADQATLAAQRAWRSDLIALAAALERNRTGSWPTATQAATIKDYFIAARKTLP